MIDSTNVRVNNVTNKTEGLVSEIQRYSVHDGPGIRTMVFLKGCFLTCPWCCNPESKNPLPLIGYHASKCIGCKQCADICPSGAIYFDKKGMHYNRNSCTVCELCAQECPSGALRIHGKTMTVNEVMQIALRDQLFYTNSGGGVTISGGEPFYQPEFLFQLLTAFKKKGIHTAIETTGYVEWPAFEKVLDSLDFLLFDLKIFDPVKHQLVLGVDNEIILQNLIRCSEKSIPIHVRIPVIPGYTDDRENITQIARFLQPLNHIQKVHLLPYHRIGMTKYKQIGESYQLEKTELPTTEYLKKLADIMISSSLNVCIGG